tara:strand:- start:328 stop:468 length:141 start_codon:yes stop_codon:yes gene_type:complete
MSKETYQDIKRISGDELRQLLTDLVDFIVLATSALIGDNFVSPIDS